MKRMVLLTVCCLAILTALWVDHPASANVVSPRGTLPWKVEQLIQNSDVRSIAVAYNSRQTVGAPLVAYNDIVNYKYQRAYRVGAGEGNCGSNQAWVCGDIIVPEWEGNYNDVAFFRYPGSNSTITGYIISKEMDYEYYYYAIYAGGSVGHKLLDVGYFPGGSFGSQPSLIYDQAGNPMIALIVHGSPNDFLVYIHDVGSGGSCASMGGPAFMDCDVILFGANIADDPSIAVTAGGSPRIAYYDPVNSALGYAYPHSNPDIANCGPNDDWRCINIDSALNTGKYPSLAIDDEMYIGYYNYSTGALMTAHYVSNNGNCGMDWNGSGYVNRWQCDQIDMIGAQVNKMGLALVVDGTAPVMAYMDSTGYQATVRLAQPIWRLDFPYGNCGPEDPLSTWYCETIDQGPYSMGEEIDMAVNESGALLIAYLEKDDYDLQNHLWVARQYFQGYLPLLKK